jgi:hypothetical protein
MAGVDSRSKRTRLFVRGVLEPPFAGALDMDDWRRGGGRGDGDLETVSEPEVNRRKGRSLLRRERDAGEAEAEERECG